MQSLLRHANPGITMGIYTHAVSSKKREAQSRVVEMVLPASRKKPIVMAVGGTA
jgi:integrase